MQKSQASSKQQIKWQIHHLDALFHLFDCLAKPPMLAFPDYNLPFTLHTDASTTELGAVLYQRQDCKMIVIAHASRTLTATEKNHNLHAGKLDPLAYIVTSAKLNATTQRWVSELTEFNFNIKYCPGRSNIDADVLLRMPFNTDEHMPQCRGELATHALQAIEVANCGQQRSEFAWISALSARSANFELQEHELLGPKSQRLFNESELA